MLKDSRAMVSMCCEFVYQNQLFFYFAVLYHALFVEISFTRSTPGGSSYILSEMWLNYYGSGIEEEDAAVLTSSKLLSLENSFSPGKNCW